jgi:hypothetical protein
MSVIITFMFDPAKLQMNCARASGTSMTRNDRVEVVDLDASASDIGSHQMTADEPQASIAPKRVKMGAAGAGVTPRTLRREDLGLLGVELGFGQNALVLELSEFLELRNRVWRGCRCLGRGRILLLLGLLVGLLLGPAVPLAAGDSVGHGGRRSGDDCRPGDSSQ